MQSQLEEIRSTARLVFCLETTTKHEELAAAIQDMFY